MLRSTTRPTLSGLLLLGAFALAATGCPEPVVENPGDPDGIDEGATTRGVMGDNSAVGPAPSGPGPAGEAPAGAVPDADLDPLHSQDELATGALLKGTLGCEACTGKLLVRVLPPPPDAAGGSDEGIVLITQKVFDGAGPFEIRVPSDRKSVVLQVVEDADGSGKPSTGERMGLVIDGPITVAPVVEGIALTVGVFPTMGTAPPTEGLAPGTEPPGGGLNPAGAAPSGPQQDGEAKEPKPTGAGDQAILNGTPPATGAPTGNQPPPVLPGGE